VLDKTIRFFNSLFQVY